MAGTAATLVTPTWVNVGPSPISEHGQLDDGAIPALAIEPTNADRIFIGSADGGVWRTTDGTNTSPSRPSWTHMTETLPFLGISDLAFSPLDGTENTLFVATGRLSNSFVQPGPSVGIDMTTNANAAAGSVIWTQLGSGTLTGLTITSMVPTGVLDPTTGK